MNIDIASIDMVSEVNMVSSAGGGVGGREPPAAARRVTAARSPSLPSHGIAAASAGGGRAARGAERCPVCLKTLFPRGRVLPAAFPFSLPAAASAGVRGSAEPGTSDTPFLPFPARRRRSVLAGAPLGRRRDAEQAGGVPGAGGGGLRPSVSRRALSHSGEKAPAA